MIRPLLSAAFLCLALTAPSIRAVEPTYDVVAAFAKLGAGGTQSLTLPPGRYVLPKGGLTLDKVRDVEIQAKGVTFVATDLQASALKFQACENVSIQGLTVDYDPLPFTQGTITAVDAAVRTILVQIHAGYPEPTEVYLAPKQLHLFDKGTGHPWKVGAPDYYPKAMERLSATEVRITFSKEARGFEYMEAGDQVAVTVRKQAAVDIKEGCRGLRFENVTVQAAPGIGFLARFVEDGGVYKSVRIVPGLRPQGAVEERLLSTSADGINVAYARKGAVIEGGEFSRMGDDGVNLHGVMLPVLEWKDDRTLLTMRPNRDPFQRLIRAGDVVRFIQEPNYELVTTAEVESFTRVEDPARAVEWGKQSKTIWPTAGEAKPAGLYEVRLKKAVSGVKAGVQVDALTFLEVPAVNATGFTIKDNFFHDHRARGLRLMACDGVVENNRFERLKGAAITLGGEFAFWREAGWCRNITVQGNRITDVAQGRGIAQRDSYGPGAIALMAHVVPLGAGTKYFAGNQNIQVLNNVIDGCSVSGIHVAAADQVRIAGNVITRVHLANKPEAGAEYGFGGSEPILIHQSTAVTVEPPQAK